ncbi:MAG: M23 family metallopeptidase [Flavobacteriaceae bacterium]
MSNSAKRPGNKKNPKQKYKVVVSNDETFEEIISLKTNNFQLFLFALLYTILVVIFSTTIIFFTQVREYVPGYPSTDLLVSAAKITVKADSLEKELALNAQFFSAIESVLKGDSNETAQRLEQDTLIKNDLKEAEIVATIPQDSILRAYVDNQDRFNLTRNQLLIDSKRYYSPVKGVVTDGFDIEKNHFAVDVSVDIGTPVKALLAGTVLFSEWSIETGHVILLDHGENLISVYKHNSKILKSQNDTVQAGEVIAFSGEEGALSSGPHLHFEIWRNGLPIDPETILSFE